MVIPNGFIEAIVRRSALEGKGSGLAEELIEKYNLAENSYDKDLLIIPLAMSERDKIDAIEKIEKNYHLVHLDESGSAKDFVICSRIFGLMDKCNWLSEKYFAKKTTIGGREYSKGSRYYTLCEE